jgi:hypothetical protein
MLNKFVSVVLCVLISVPQLLNAQQSGQAPSAVTPDNAQPAKADSGAKASADITPDQMADICNKRASLGDQQAKLADAVPTDKLELQTLYQQFQKNAANAQWWGDYLNKVNKDSEQINHALDKLDPLDQLKKVLKTPDVQTPTGSTSTIPTSTVPSEEIGEKLSSPLEELDDYKTIAQGVVAWVDDISAIAGNIKINQTDATITNDLSTLQTWGKKLVDDLANFQRVNQALAALPACDTTKLVQKEPSPSNASPSSSTDSSSTPPPAKQAATSSGNHAGLILGTVLVGGALVGGVAAAESMSHAATTTSGSSSGGNCSAATQNCNNLATECLNDHNTTACQQMDAACTQMCQCDGYSSYNGNTGSCQ